MIKIGLIMLVMCVASFVCLKIYYASLDTKHKWEYEVCGYPSKIKNVFGVIGLFWLATFIVWVINALIWIARL